MIICPWCGTNYLVFQSNCKNCGGLLQWADDKNDPSDSTEMLIEPPTAPRLISDKYVWRLITGKGGWIVTMVFGILGLVFSLVGGGLILGIATSFIGIPFFLLGIGFLVAGGWLFIRIYQSARKIVSVLRDGQAVRGEIIEIHQNFSVRINGRFSWVIQYQFQANGQNYDGTVSTLNSPGPQLQAGKASYVLYLPDAPKWNSIYPHP